MMVQASLKKPLLCQIREVIVVCRKEGALGWLGDWWVWGGHSLFYSAHYVCVCTHRDLHAEAGLGRLQKTAPAAQEMTWMWSIPCDPPHSAGQRTPVYELDGAKPRWTAPKESTPSRGSLVSAAPWKPLRSPKVWLHQQWNPEQILTCFCIYRVGTIISAL